MPDAETTVGILNMEEEVAGVVKMNLVIISDKLIGRKIALGDAVKAFVQDWVKNKAKGTPHVFISDYIP